MKIITVTGYKGGVGKSTTAFHLATFFSEHGRTLLIDSDPNRSSLKWAERGAKSGGYCVPFRVADGNHALRMISESDYLIIDTPARPQSDDLKDLATGGDLLILPTSPDILSLEPMLETARLLQGATYRALITVVPPLPSREGQTMQRELREAGVPVFGTMIRRTAGFAKAALLGKPIRDLETHRARLAWTDYKTLGNEILEVIS